MSTITAVPSSLVKDDALGVAIRRGTNLDAFGRLRVSQPTALWYDTLQYDTSPLLWSQKITGNATATHSYGDSGVHMTVSGLGDKVSRQVKQPVRYQPGKSRLDVLTWGSPDIPENVRFRTGAFNNSDGVFVQIENNQWAFGVRSSVSGTPTDNVIPQSTWNKDKLDGTGSSGITLNPASGQIFVTDLQWLSLGIVRFGFEFDGELIVAHETRTANDIYRPYMQTANLPIRYELESFGGDGSVAAICSSSMSEGGNISEKGYNFSTPLGRVPKTVAATDAWTPIVSIRRKTLFKGNPYSSAVILPTKFSSFCTGNTIQIGIMYRPTLTGSVWQDVNVESGVEMDVSATAATGGILSDVFYLSAGGQGNSTFASAGSEETAWLLPITCDCEGEDPDVVTIVARAIGTSTSQAYATIDYREIR